jgi:hypothetical protein
MLLRREDENLRLDAGTTWDARYDPRSGDCSIEVQKVISIGRKRQSISGVGSYRLSTCRIDFNISNIVIGNLSWRNDRAIRQP